MEVAPKSLSDARARLTDGVAQLGLPIRLRAVGEYHAMDDSILYARSETREVIVGVAENVGWGPDLDTYVSGVDEFHDLECLFINVPNTLDAKMEQVIDAVRAWFSD